MAKKRKSGGNHASNDGPNMENIGASRKRIRDYTDVADSDDEFHLNRDEVLLGEAPEAKRRRKQQEQEQFLDDAEEEVLGVESEGDEDDDQYDEDEEGGADGAVDEDPDDEFRWGVGKDDMYGADAIETEEQALEEEAEALRLQKKQLQGMSAADYGFDEAGWQGQGDVEDPARTEGAVVTEVLPQLQIPEDMGSAERLKLLKSRYPEFKPLSKELLRMREMHDTFAREIDEIDELDLIPNLTTKSRAAAAYLGSLTMYFALLCSPASGGAEGAIALSADRLRDHPVMDSLVRCRELWQRAERLPEDFDYLTESEEEEEVETGLAAEDQQSTDVQHMLVQQPSEKTRAQRYAEALQAAAAARQAERLQRTEDNLADLDTLLAQNAAKRKTKSKQSGKKENKVDSDLGEEAPLTAEEAAEKARHRKSLRFYTSQIAQKANKRGAAGRNAGGDDDVPYRERLRDRQIRLNAEAEKRGQQSSSKNHDPAADLGGDSDEEDARQARQIRAEANASDDDYYDLVAARTAKKKADRAALADAQREAAQHGGRVVEEETVGADGKRKISYAIEKNKGLTPHRKKDVRNPRVKKRKKFEDKRKKLASMKPVYKGGEGRGGYGGELTGIKSGLVKSTKL